MMNKRGQITIFIIIALLLFASVSIYFIFGRSSSTEKVPAQMEPVYEAFLECLEQDAKTGVSVLESQGGYIKLPEFSQGSEYMPFSSQLNFLGNPIPYWYYVSGNNIPRENIPSKSDMEDQLGDFIESRFKGCEFQSYREQGFEISLGNPEADVSIGRGEVEVSFDMDLGISINDETSFVRKHEVSFDSSLGRLYDSARKVYFHEQDNLFLEEYAIDNLRLYAPVDGTEISCSPLIWNADEIFNNLQEAIEVNTLALGTDREEDYYNINLSIEPGQKVSFLNSRLWPYTFEVSPSEEFLLRADPVGSQPGLGLLGFCYIPYHFVYDIKYPVLVQIQDEHTEEIFQFPMAVVVQGNKPRKALAGAAAQDVDIELCKFKNTEMQVRTKDSFSDPVDADISYECFGQRCNIGITRDGVLREEFPQCVNGYILTRTEGFRDGRYLFSTVSSGNIEIVLDKLYQKQVSLKVNGIPHKGDAIITFSAENDVRTMVYQDNRVIELGEGFYEVEVYIYEDSDVNIGAKVTEQCIDVPSPHIFGALGLTQEKCFDIEVPEQVFSNALAGGGKQNHFISEVDLLGSNRIEIRVESFPTPDTVQQIQDNYNLFERKGVELNFI